MDDNTGAIIEVSYRTSSELNLSEYTNKYLFILGYLSYNPRFGVQIVTEKIPEIRTTETDLAHSAEAMKFRRDVLCKPWVPLNTPKDIGALSPLSITENPIQDDSQTDDDVILNEPDEIQDLPLESHHISLESMILSSRADNLESDSKRIIDGDLLTTPPGAKRARRSRDENIKEISKNPFTFQSSEGNVSTPELAFQPVTTKNLNTLSSSVVESPTNPSKSKYFIDADEKIASSVLVKETKTVPSVDTVQSVAKSPALVQTFHSKENEQLDNNNKISTEKLLNRLFQDSEVDSEKSSSQQMSTFIDDNELEEIVADITDSDSDIERELSAPLTFLNSNSKPTLSTASASLSVSSSKSSPSHLVVDPISKSINDDELKEIVAKISDSDEVQSDSKIKENTPKKSAKQFDLNGIEVDKNGGLDIKPYAKSFEYSDSNEAAENELDALFTHWNAEDDNYGQLDLEEKPNGDIQDLCNDKNNNPPLEPGEKTKIMQHSNYNYEKYKKVPSKYTSSIRSGDGIDDYDNDDVESIESNPDESNWENIQKGYGSNSGFNESKEYEIDTDYNAIQRSDRLQEAESNRIQNIYDSFGVPSVGRKQNHERNRKPESDKEGKGSHIVSKRLNEISDAGPNVRRPSHVFSSSEALLASRNESCDASVSHLWQNGEEIHSSPIAEPFCDVVCQSMAPLTATKSDDSHLIPEILCEPGSATFQRLTHAILMYIQRRKGHKILVSALVTDVQLMVYVNYVTVYDREKVEARLGTKDLQHEAIVRSIVSDLVESGHLMRSGLVSDEVKAHGKWNLESAVKKAIQHRKGITMSHVLNILRQKVGGVVAPDVAQAVTMAVIESDERLWYWNPIRKSWSLVNS